MTMFNYFLVITGILVSGYVTAINDKMFSTAECVCIFGFVQCICFLMIDIRSRQMIRYGEDVLDKLERDVLFPDGFRAAGARGKQLGLRRCDEDQREGGPFAPHRLLKMKFWIRGMYVLAAAGFVLAGVSAVWHWGV
jgi:hypothetical protein